MKEARKFMAWAIAKVFMPERKKELDLELQQGLNTHEETA